MANQFEAKAVALAIKQLDAGAKNESPYSLLFTGLPR